MDREANQPSLERQLLAMSNEELGRVDPVVVTLPIAKGIPALADLEIGRYVAIADDWAADLRARMPPMEQEFHKTPHDWRNDLDFFRVGAVCWYIKRLLPRSGAGLSCRPVSVSEHLEVRRRIGENAYWTSQASMG
jgi:hypothetical protein